jgi:TolB-like protein
MGAGAAPYAGWAAETTTPKLMGKTLKALALAIVAALPREARAAGDEYDALAASLSSAAARQQVRRVAAVPFQGARGAESYSGGVLVSRLAARLLSAGAVEVVERGALDSVLSEQQLASTGLLDPATVAALGRLLGADAIVTGTIIPLRNSRVEVHARLVHAATGRVLGAASAVVSRDWEDAPAEDAGSWAPPIPRLPGAEPLRDAPRDGLPTCAERALTLESSLVELEARHWAERLRDPAFDRRSLIRNPGSDIRGHETRAKFYERLKAHWRDPGFAPLAAHERALREDGRRRLDFLAQTCESYREGA